MYNINYYNIPYPDLNIWVEENEEIDASPSRPVDVYTETKMIKFTKAAECLGLSDYLLLNKLKTNDIPVEMIKHRRFITIENFNKISQIILKNKSIDPSNTNTPPSSETDSSDDDEQSKVRIYPERGMTWRQFLFLADRLS